MEARPSSLKQQPSRQRLQQQQQQPQQQVAHQQPLQNSLCNGGYQQQQQQQQQSTPQQRKKLQQQKSEQEPPSTQEQDYRQQQQQLPQHVQHLQQQQQQQQQPGTTQSQPQQLKQQQHQLLRSKLGLRSSSASSLSSVGSAELIRITTSPKTRRRWSTLETLGRAMFLLSVIFFVVGVVITVLGFVSLGITAEQQLPMKIIGPACLVVTVAAWLIGVTVVRLWKVEWERQRQAIEMRTRVQLHAMAMDILKKPSVNLSPGVLRDPRLRKQMLMKLRKQKALDISSIDTLSRCSSRRNSSLLSTIFRPSSNHDGASTQGVGGGGGGGGGWAGGRRSMDTLNSSGAGSGYHRAYLPSQFIDLPGIHISRIETLDVDDAGFVTGGGVTRTGGGGATTRLILIQSDASSDASRFSFPSECSLSGASRSSRSRSSKESSNFSSRLWDFSPLESYSDIAMVVVGAGSRGGGVSGGGGSGGRDGGVGRGRDYTLLSPTIPRASVVTFDVGEPGVRRHSSPASSQRRRDSMIIDNDPGGSGGGPKGADSTQYSSRGGGGGGGGGGGDYPPAYALTGPNVSGGYNIGRYSGNFVADDFRKKSTGDQSLISFTINENDGDEDDDIDVDDDCDDDVLKEGGRCRGDATTLYRRSEKTHDSGQGGGLGHGVTLVGARMYRSASTAAATTRPFLDRITAASSSSSLRRANTDDSEIERRMSRIFDEIKYSLTDSLEEPRGGGLASSTDGGGQGGGVGVSRSEAETQTLTDQELMEVSDRTGDGRRYANVYDENRDGGRCCGVLVRELSKRECRGENCADDTIAVNDNVCNNFCSEERSTAEESCSVTSSRDYD